MNELYTIKQVSELLQISEIKAKALFNTEGFPETRIGKDRRVFADDLENYLRSNKQIKLDYSKV